MKNTICNAAEIWKQFEDLLVPRLGLSVFDRAAYSHLLRHSRIEGKVRLQFGILWLARGTGLSSSAARAAVRRLVSKGALRLMARNRGGHLVEVRSPAEIRGVRARLNVGKAGPNIEEIDFLGTRAWRTAIHAREAGRCFYCLRRLTPALQSLDHVVPQARSGLNSYRNLVSSCLECNSQKSETPAGDFLRWLYREGRLTAVELAGRLRALEDLASGKLPPPLEYHAAHVEAGLSPSSFPLESHAGHKCSAGFTPASCSGRSSDRRFSSGEFIPTRSGARLPPPVICSEQANSGLTAPADSASVSTTALAEIERTTILHVFDQANGDKALAGKMLGISRATLYRKLKRYNIPTKRPADSVAAAPPAPSQQPAPAAPRC